MNKKFTKLIAALALLVFMTPTMAGWGQTRTEEVYKTLTFCNAGTSQNKIQDYTSSWTETISNFSWTISNFNNNNWGWTDGGNPALYIIKCGRKKVNNANTPSVATITTDAAIDKAITKVVVKLTAISASDYNSIKLYVASNSAFSENLTTINVTPIPTSAGDMTITIPEANRAANRFYKLEFDTKGSTTNNGHTGVSKVEYYKEDAPTFNITAQSNNTSLGTVSLSGSVITGAPVDNCRYASPAYTVEPANSATVAQDSEDNNKFTVTPTANTTVTINFEAIPSHTATFSVNGTTSTQDFAEGSAIVFPNTPSEIYEKMFLGWTSDEIEGTTNTAPTIVTSATMGSSDVTYYAVYATATPGAPVETKTQTLEYDTWSYSSSNTSNQNSYRLFGNGGYVESAAFDLSKLTKVIVYGGTYGGGDYKYLTIGDGTNTWKEVTVSGSSQTGTNTYTDGNALSGTNKLYVTSTCGNGSSSGVRMSKIEIFTNEPSYTYSNYCTTVAPPAVVRPVITVAENPFLFSTTVTITCETEGATIYYSYDNNTWTEYTAVLTITETKTIYAKAVKGSDESTVASVIATKNLAEPTVTINATGITNTNVFMSTAAGSLAASVTYDDVVIEGASVTWSGNADAVATINSTTGVVTLVAAGSVTFTATYAGNGDYSEKTATYEMSVANFNPNIPTYTLVTSVADIVPGVHYVIANSKTAGTAYAMDSQNTNYRNRKQITVKNEDKDGDGNADTFIQSSEVYEFVFSGDGTNYWTVYDEGQTTNHYLAATGGTNNNYLSVLGSVEGKTKWSISIDGTTKEATIVAQITGDEARNHIRYNNSSDQERFACYKSTNAFPKVYIYKKDSDSNCHIYSATNINSNMTVSGDMNIHAGVFTVKNDATLTVEGTLTNTTAANLIIEEGGQLITNSENVQATVKKTIAAHGATTADGGWNFIASPINSNSLDPATIGFSMITDELGDEATVTTATYDLYKFVENPTDNGKEWKNYRNAAFNLANGQGYLYASKGGTTLNFMGFVNSSADVNVNLAYTEGVEFAGWNLVGNPFTFNAYVNRSFYKMNDDGSAILAEVQASGSTIAPCTGIMVKATAETGQSVTFSKEPIVNAPSNGNVSIAVVQVNERGASTTTIDNAIVSFNEGNELPKFYFMEQNANLYIPQGEKEYAIATSEGQGEMPLNFRANTDGQYVLTVNPEGVEMNYLHLVDNMTGNDVDLLATPSYTFNAKTTDYESRFRLVFAANNENGVSAGSTTFAFYSNGNWMVNNEGEATLQVIDVMGRVLSSQTISGTAELSLNQQPGVYVLRLVNGNDVKTQKIVVR